MTRILIEEWLSSNGANAHISFDRGPVYPATITDPFTPEQEADLAWYFEQHLEYPFMAQKRAELVAASIRPYGEQLFNQVLSSPTGAPMPPICSIAQQG